MTCKMGVIGRVFLVRWQKPQLADLASILRSLADARAKSAVPLMYVAIAPADSEPPDDETRQAMMNMMPEVLEHCDKMCFVMEGTGFKHSINRSALTGILLMSGKRGRTFVEDTVEKALKHAEDVNVPAVVRGAAAQGFLTK